MMPRTRLLISWAVLLGLTVPVVAGTQMASESWKYSPAEFTVFSKRIQSMATRNLLLRPGVEVRTDGHEKANLLMLVDGEAGVMGAQGRVFLGGSQPAVITFYLGGLKTIHEIGSLGFNGDTRANQDYEVRWADNSRRPGVQPAFGGEPDLTTGNKVLGADRGGFHSRFFDDKGAPIAKADWVQFRIYPTLGTKAGEPAKTLHGQGQTVVCELEVLGADSDVVPLSKPEVAYRQAIINVAKPPELVKKDTWQESMVASREALWKWESEQDLLATHDAAVRLGPWHVLGPISPKSKDLAKLRGTKTVAFAEHWTNADGKELTWQKCEDLQDGQINDWTRYRDAGKDAVFFVCRDVGFPKAIQKDELYLELWADQGSAVWLPTRQAAGLQTSKVLRDGSNLWNQEGECQLLVELRAGADAQRRFLFAMRPRTSRPGAGPISSRLNLRRQLVSRVQAEFTAPADQMRITWEIENSIWGNVHDRGTEDWLPGDVDCYLQPKYRAALQDRLQKLTALLDETSGVKAQAIADVKDRLQAWTAEMIKSLAPAMDTAALRNMYYQACSLQEAIALAGRVRSMRLAVEDHQAMFQDRYPKAGTYFARIADLEKQAAALWEPLLGNPAAGISPLVGVKKALETAQAEVLLDTPLLAFGKLLLAKGSPGFNSNWGGPNRIGQEIVTLSPVRPDGQQTSIYKGTVSDMDLNWDGRRLLFSDARVLWEMNVDGSGLRRVSAEDSPVTHYDGCYLPNGRIVCVSNSPEQAVPCTGGPDVGNLHLMDADGKNEQRVTFDQDHDWNPTILNDGRVLYTRWEYTDIPHYFSRMLFRMNPDGSAQMEYYGSGSYWPNAMYWPRPIPGHPTAVSCIVSGHHGVSRTGELLLLDPARGRHEADGVIQRIPGYQQKVEPVILDQLVVNVWPKFAAPYPLAEAGTNLGAGKYFLACVQRNAFSTWDLYLVDIFDNLTPILTGGYMTPVPVQARPVPPVIPSNLDPHRHDGLIYLADIYQGEGLRGYPRGSIKALRVGTHHYRYPGNGDTYASSLEGGWDVKRILGTVPVNEDGSALFRVPANTPIFLQPLDAEGKAQQQMRSWYTAVPGETASCIGCHERQNNGPPNKHNVAAQRRPSEIVPWNGPARGFSFDREVQPVLDHRCAGCHNGQPVKVGDQQITTLDLRAKQLLPDYTDRYSPAYVALQRYVRRAGYEADMHLQVPAEYEADTSALVQLLKKGHYNVELSPDDWERLYAWIDYNVPYPANWRESHRPPRDEQVERRAAYKKQFAGLEDHDEDPLPLPPVAKYEAPRPGPARPTAFPTAPGWPMTAEQAAELQKKAGPADLELDLGDSVAMKFRLVPAGQFVMGDVHGAPDEWTPAAVRIEQPFYLGQIEVTNQQYAQFDRRHDSGYIDGRGKDRTTRGAPVNQPDAPVVRVSWHEAMTFCEWLSQKTGYPCTLPTEAQWEWACRAGTASTYAFGEYAPGMKNVANIADESIARWNYGRAETGYNDGAGYSVPGGRYPANAWGLFDMHGNVAEWCLSAYRPYPYRGDDGRDDPRAPGLKAVRGGSWNDTMRSVTSASRWRYQPYQPVYNVGFRVLVEPKPKTSVAWRERL